MEIITGISIKQILQDNWESFCKHYWKLIRDSSFESVNKVLQCWSPEIWFSSYKCDKCNEIKHIHFTCKSRFCNSCGKPLSDLWINKLLSRLPKNIQYFHFIFTIPIWLRAFFRRHRDAQKMLHMTAKNTILHIFHNKYKCTPWIISVLHTFWAQLNRNSHIHTLITAGWFKHDNSYISTKGKFMPFKLFNVSRRKYLINNTKDRIEKNLHGNTLIEERRLLNSFFSQKDPKNPSKEKSRYIYFSPKATCFEIVLSYIWRYLKRPIIAQSRILAYDKKNVTFSYIDKYDGLTKFKTLPVFEFIGELIQHIPNKFFKNINYWWAFANRSKKRYLRLFYRSWSQGYSQTKVPSTFRQRIIAFTGKDPQKCSCWWMFHKYQTIIPWYPPFYYDTS